MIVFSSESRVVFIIFLYNPFGSFTMIVRAIVARSAVCKQKYHS